MENRRPIKSKTVPFNWNDESGCKICLENSLQDQIISPCLCTGSIQYVHEECLKTWILAKWTDLSQASCEVCKTQYPMSYELQNTCICKRALLRNTSRVILIFLLLSMELLILFASYFLIEKYQNSPTEKATHLTLGLIGMCVVTSFLLLLLIVMVVKTVCIAKTLHK